MTKGLQKDYLWIIDRRKIVKYFHDCLPDYTDLRLRNFIYSGQKGMVDEFEKKSAVDCNKELYTHSEYD